MDSEYNSQINTYLCLSYTGLRVFDTDIDLKKGFFPFVFFKTDKYGTS